MSDLKIRHRRPPVEDQKISFAVVERPVITTTTLPQELLDTIAKTARSGKAVELKFEGDPIGCRRVVQRINGLSKRGVWRYPVTTARRGGSLYVWLKRPKKGRKERPAKALPPVVTPPRDGFPPATSTAAAPRPSEPENQS